MFSLHRYNRKSFIPCVIFASLILVIGADYSHADSFLKTRVETISAPRLKNEYQIKQVLRTLDVPEEIGFIKEIYVPKNPSGKMIINIQDLHCNYKAQKNIASILEHLLSTYGLKLISVEGGSGKIDTTFYRELPDVKIKEQVADYFLRQARINGTEYFAITTNREIALYGAEDERYYDKNLEAFLKALPNRERILNNISVLENSLNILKNKIYNKKLRELDDRIVAYDNGELEFEDYILYISNLYSRDKLGREFRQVNQLVESIKIKQDLDLEQAQEQRKELIDHLSRYLPRQGLEVFLKTTAEFKAKTLDTLSYHQTLKQLYTEMERKEKAFDRMWPQLNLYVEYLSRHETLDKFILFTEIDKLVERIKNSLYTSYTQKKLDHNLRIIRLARNLFSTKLLNHDLNSMKKYRNDFDGKKIKKFIITEGKRLKLDLAVPADSDLEQMRDTLPDLEDFYRYASERNHILATNTLKGMEQEKESIGILITGGFHTEGISEYLEDKRIAYIVVCPKIEKIEEDDEQRYLNALQGKKTPFEEQLEREGKLAKQN